MNLYKAELKVKSALGTDLAADTMFGHICWAMYYKDGEEHLQKFLCAMESPSPPLILSDPFPSGFLPVPVTVGPTKNQQSKNDSVKDIVRQKLISCRLFEDIKDCISGDSVFQQLIHQAKSQDESRIDKKHIETCLMPHNHVNRLGGGTIGGGVFFTEEQFWAADKNTFDMYVMSAEYTDKMIQDILHTALKCGYGRDKSTGKGVIEVASVKPASLPKADSPNAVMLLGPCVPAANDPVDGFWRIKAKAGRLGGHWAVTYSPFKRTLMMLQPGSILLTDKPRPYYGQMVHNVHPELNEVVHYGIAPALPVKLEKSVLEAA